VQTEQLGVPDGAPPGRLDAKAFTDGIAVESLEGLACDGVWVWRAERVDTTHVVVTLADQNHHAVRKSCATFKHERVVVALPKGTYHLHVSMPPGYVTLDRDVTVG
jgi:hypothetical protein